MKENNVWAGRWRTTRAMGHILRAKWLIHKVPISRWQGEIGYGALDDSRKSALTDDVRQWAAHVDRAARRMPVSAKCLPQAVALSRILRQQQIAHCVVIAHQKDPSIQDDDPDMLHAWLEIDGAIILGELPGNWHEILRMPQ